MHSDQVIHTDTHTYTMNIIETVRRLFASSPTVEGLEAAEAELEKAGAVAKAKAAELWKGHASRTLEFMSMSDEGAAKRSRTVCEEADRRLLDIEAAQTDVRSRLEAARSAWSAASKATAWAATETKLQARSAAMGRLQAMLGEVAAEHKRLLDLTEAAWQSLPGGKPSSRPPTFTGADLATRLNLYLFGVSGGRLGNGAGLNAHVVSQRRDLVTDDHEAVLMLMALKPEAVTETAGVTP